MTTSLALKSVCLTAEYTTILGIFALLTQLSDPLVNHQSTWTDPHVSHHLLLRSGLYMIQALREPAWTAQLAENTRREINNYLSLFFLAKTKKNKKQKLPIETNQIWILAIIFYITTLVFEGKFSKLITKFILPLFLYFCLYVHHYVTHWSGFSTILFICLNLTTLIKVTWNPVVSKFSTFDYCFGRRSWFSCPCLWKHFKFKIVIIMIYLIIS